MLEDYVGGEFPRFKIGWDGWLFTKSILPNNDVYGLHDQDFIHNGMKLVNPLDNATQHLVFGNENTTPNQLFLVHHTFTVDHHGLQKGDGKREDRQQYNTLLLARFNNVWS